MSDSRRLAVALVGFCAFLQLYATQSLLPLFAAEFRASPAAVSLTVSATALGVALVAPFAGALADRVGRRRVMLGALFALALPTALVATADSLEALVAWRFLQGLLLPPIFAVAVAYIGEEWPAEAIPTVIGVYTAGSALGGFSSRFVSGIAADHLGWRAAFLVMAAMALLGAAIIARHLPRERKFVPAESFAGSLLAMGRHLRNPRLVVTFAVGFAILFSFAGAFTYVNFHLSAPPFSLSLSALGSIFVVYLFGVVVTPWSGRAVARFGRRRVGVVMILVWAGALALTLLPSLAAIVAGLGFAAAAGFICQALANGFIAGANIPGRSGAVGLYVSSYYIGGSIGALLPAPTYAAWGWPGVVAMVIGVLALMAAAVLAAWREPKTS